jgi:hypothetical protein
MIDIYYDIDGCINAFSNKPPRANTFWKGEWDSAKIEGLPILWSKELVDEINALDARSDVRSIWLTDWQELAASDFAPQTGIHGVSWPVLTGDVQSYPWWKLEAIQTSIEQGNPDKIVWIDDNLKYSKEVVAWLKDHPEIHTVTPQPNHGVTKKQISGIIEFINA